MGCGEEDLSRGKKGNRRATVSTRTWVLKSLKRCPSDALSDFAVGSDGDPQRGNVCLPAINKFSLQAILRTFE